MTQRPAPSTQILVGRQGHEQWFVVTATKPGEQPVAPQPLGPDSTADGQPAPLIEKRVSPALAMLVQTTRARTTTERAERSSAKESFASSPGSSGSE